MPTTTVDIRVSLIVTVFDLYNRLRITRLIGMFHIGHYINHTSIFDISMKTAHPAFTALVIPA